MYKYKYTKQKRSNNGIQKKVLWLVNLYPILQTSSQLVSNNALDYICCFRKQENNSKNISFGILW